MTINLVKKFVSSLLLEPVTLNSKSDLSGNVVVITGGSQGIGKAMAKVLSQQGAQVTILSRTGSDTNENIYSIRADVTDGKQVDSAVTKIIQKYGKIDVLINNAGKFLDKPIDQIKEEEYDSLMDTNVKGVFLMSKAIVPHMKKAKKGLIINIGSKISHNTNVSPNKVLYATSKYAIEGFSLALSKELKASGIRVTCLMLGTVNTFISFKSKDYLSPYKVADVITMIIKNDTVDFESIILKSVKQDI